MRILRSISLVRNYYDENIVLFNGARIAGLDTGNDAFVMTRLHTPSPGEPRDELGRYAWWCLTKRMPYDLVVTTALMRFKVRFGPLVDIYSDGNWRDLRSDEWLCDTVFGIRSAGTWTAAG